MKPTRRQIMMAGAALLTAVTFALAWDGQFDLLLLVTWGASLVLWWRALTDKKWGSAAATSGRRAPVRVGADGLLRSYEYGLVLLGGALALFINLDGLPYDMLSDHGAYLHDVLRVIDGARDIYFADNSGREPFIMYAAAALAPLTGVSYLSLKLISATAALLTLPALYLIGRDLDGRLTGLLALVLGAFCDWHLLTGRFGFRITLASLASAWLLWVLLRALRGGRRVDFLLAGAILGAGMYGYTAFRIAPLLILVGAVLAGWAIWRGRRAGSGQSGRGEIEPGGRGKMITGGRGMPRPYEGGMMVGGLARNLLSLGVVALAVSAPLLSYMLAFPQFFWWRVDAFTADTQAVAPLDYVTALVESLLMFFNGRDEIASNLIRPGAAVISAPLAMLFALGLAVAVGRCIRRRDLWLLFVLLALIIFLLPSALGVSIPEETPSSRRAIAALPVVLVLSAVGLAWLIERIAALPRPQARRSAWIVGTAVLLMHVGVSLYTYFVVYPRYYSPGSPREIAGQFRDFIDEGGSSANTFVVTDGEWLDKRLIGIWLGEPDWANLINREINAALCERLRAQRRANGPLMIQVIANAETMADLTACFPLYDSYGYMARDGVVLNVLLVP
jgi:4-amino-4-deoxy-L-arabinose transferase-like glycosyltransferase